MKVRDLMHRQPRVTSPGSSLAAAGKIMAEVDCGCLPVVGDEDRVVGVITDRDISLALTRLDRRASEIQVRQVMSGEVFTCGPDDDVREAMGVMRKRRVRRLVVVDDSRNLAGILSLDDIVLEARAIETQGFTGPFYSDVVMTLRAICLHHPPAKVA